MVWVAGAAKLKDCLGLHCSGIRHVSPCSDVGDCLDFEGHAIPSRIGAGEMACTRSLRDTFAGPNGPITREEGVASRLCETVGTWKASERRARVRRTAYAVGTDPRTGLESFQPRSFCLKGADGRLQQGEEASSVADTQGGASCVIGRLVCLVVGCVGVWIIVPVFACDLYVVAREVEQISTKNGRAGMCSAVCTCPDIREPAYRLPGGQNNLYLVCGVCPGMRGVAHSSRPCVLKHNGSVLIPDIHSCLYPVKDCRVISQSHLERIDSAAGLVHGGMGQLCDCLDA